MEIGQLDLSLHFLIYKNGDNDRNYLRVIAAMIQWGGEYNAFGTGVVVIVPTDKCYWATVIDDW